VVGDWDGDGDDTIGAVRRQANFRFQWLLRNSNTGGAAEVSAVYGLNSDQPVVGDWDDNGDDTLGVVRRTPDGRLHWLLRNSITGGAAELSFVYGLGNDFALVWR
jgi:hypothetical protein